MAIKIKGNQLPSYGRITMPKGTFLSNPATAASGGLGGPQGSNPGQPPPGMGPVGQAQVPQIGVGSFKGFLDNLFSKYTNTPMGQSAVNLASNPLNPYGSQANPVYGPPKQQDPRLTQLHGTFGQTIDLKQQPTTPSNLFKTPQSPSNSLVGSDVGSAPSQLDWNTLQQIAPGKTFQEVQTGLATKGYVWDWRNRVFVQSGQSNASTDQLANAQNQLLSTDNRGRTLGNPYEIGPTLAPGQRAVTAGHQTEAGTTVGSGVGVTGGTSYTDQSGNTVAQYAVSYGSGGDRWKYNITKDNAGNWVRTYYRTFSKARSRSAIKRAQGRREDARAQQQSQDNGINDAGGQLVNLRASFG